MEHGSEQRVRAVTGEIAKLREEARLAREPDPLQKVSFFIYIFNFPPPLLNGGLPLLSVYSTCIFVERYETAGVVLPAAFHASGGAHAST